MYQSGFRTNHSTETALIQRITDLPLTMTVYSVDEKIQSAYLAVSLVPASDDSQVNGKTTRMSPTNHSTSNHTQVQMSLRRRVKHPKIMATEALCAMLAVLCTEKRKEKKRKKKTALDALYH